MVTQASHLLIHIRNIHFLGTQPHCSLQRLPTLLGESEEWEFILCLNHLFRTSFIPYHPCSWIFYFRTKVLIHVSFQFTLSINKANCFSIRMEKQTYFVFYHLPWEGGRGHHNYPRSGTTGYKSVTVSNGTCSYKLTCSKTKKLLVTLHFILLSLLLTLLHTPFWKDGPSGNVFFLPQPSTSMKLIKWCHASFYLIWK